MSSKGLIIYSLGFLILLLCTRIIWKLPNSDKNLGMPSRESARVVVVGGGLAGLSAAYESAKAGAHVILIDKNTLGGNSAKATSGINGANTQHQRYRGITNDTVPLFSKDIIASGKGKCSTELVHTLAESSASAVEFLEQFLPRPLSEVSILGGHTAPRTHRLPPSEKPLPIGYLATSGIISSLKTLGDRIEVKENCEVVDLVFNDDHSVAGVIEAGTTETLRADAVVISSGGFAAASPSFIEKYFSKKIQFTTNGPFSTGDLLNIALSHDLKVVDLDQIQIHPTGFLDPSDPAKREKFLCPEYFRGLGGILINDKGKRFVNELKPRDEVTDAILSSESTFGFSYPVVALLLNNDVVAGVGDSIFNFYVKRGLIASCPFPGYSSLSSMLHVNEEVLNSTLSLYGQESDEFGRENTSINKFDSNKKFHFAYVTPALHYTMGGLVINTEAQLMKNDGTIIPNIFAAGEVAGGVHGANRLGGNGMLEGVVFGRIAGSNAAHAALDRRILSNGQCYVSQITSYDEATSLLRLRVPLIKESCQFVVLTFTTNLETGTYKHKVEAKFAQQGFIDIFAPKSETISRLHRGDILSFRCE